MSRNPVAGRERLPSAVRVMLEERERLLREAKPGLDGARRLAAVTIAAIATLAEDSMAQVKGRWAVIALGGFGAGRLLPGSDIDLLVLTDSKPERIKDAVSSVLYPLWDAGLTVGHQVRTHKDHLRVAREDLTVLTASLTGRVLAGDTDFGHRLLGDCAKQARSRSRRVLGEIEARPRPGSPFALEPDLKEDAGGRRDLDEMAWTAAVLAGTPTPDAAPLVGLGLLPAEEWDALREADERISAARWLLQVGRKRPSSRMTIDDAEELGFDAEGVQAAMGTVAVSLTTLRGRIARRPTEPRMDPLTPSELFGLLGHGERSIDELERLAWSGLLEPLLPGLRALMATRRPALSHRLTVGAHCLLAAALVTESGRDDTLAASALESLLDRRSLLVAALTHDFGKREPGPGHAERGAGDAFEAAVRFGLGSEDARRTALLVREHLLLAETASRKDVTAEDVIVSTAERVGDRDLLAPLYLLTVADARATGPGAWTPWHAVLIGQLVARLDAALAEDVAGVGIAAAAEHVRAEALASLARTPDAEILAAYIQAAPVGYLSTRDPDEVVAHAGLAVAVEAVRDPAHGEVAVSSGPMPRTWRVTIAALDRHGLFARLAGVFALSGLNILSADAVTDGHDIAVDSFIVTPATLADIDPHTWARFERDLHGVLADRLALEVRLAERRKHYPAAHPGVRIGVSFDVSSATTTGVRVSAPDRVGLLHDLALVLAQADLDVLNATVLTQDDVAKDTFHVTTASGTPPRGAEELESLKAALEAAASAG